MLRIGCAWALALAVIWSPAWAWGVAPGDPAPDFSLLDVGGETHALSDLQGQVVLIALIGYG